MKVLKKLGILRKFFENIGWTSIYLKRNCRQVLGLYVRVSTGVPPTVSILIS